MAKSIETWLKEDVKKYLRMSINELSNTFFFRDPPRPMYIDNEHFYAPADGVILYQKIVDPGERIVEIKGVDYTLQDVLSDSTYNKPSLVIGIFMSFYDPHIIRIPYRGAVKFEYIDPIESVNIPMLAVEKDILNKVINPNNMGYLKKNERMRLSINSLPLGYKYNMCLVADEDVNVIAPFIKNKDECEQNQRFALVRWGSQTELILPLDPRFDFELCQKDHMHVESGIDPLVKIIYK